VLTLLVSYKVGYVSELLSQEIWKILDYEVKVSGNSIVKA